MATETVRTLFSCLGVSRSETPILGMGVLRLLSTKREAPSEEGASLFGREWWTGLELVRHLSQMPFLSKGGSDC
jgi:hypothetical protein